MDRQTVFGNRFGDANHYRIPSIVTTARGTLVACADARYFGGGDNPNRIDKIVRRSMDNGKSWGEAIYPVREQGASKMRASAAIDPVMVYDCVRDRIILMYCHTPAGVGILSCSKGVAVSRSGAIALRMRGRRYWRNADGSVTNARGRETAYRIAADGGVYDGDARIGNCLTGEGPLQEQNTAYLMSVYSDDDGLTWSAPRCLNAQVKARYMGFIGPGPGVGVCMREGKHAGRLVVPIYYNSAAGSILMLSCATIYSDDGGETWQRGVSPNETRRRIVRTDKFVLPNEMLTESQLIELPGGALRLFMRNHSGKRLIAMADSTDGGQSWRDYRYNSDLPQCICQCCVLNVQDGERPATLFLNAASQKERKNGVLRLSYDYGETFAHSALIKEGGFVYSCIAATADGGVGVLYETDTEHEKIDFVRLTLDEFKEMEPWRN